MAELTPEPGTSEEWKLHKVPQVKPGDAVITASSGRTLQNKEGDLTEIPNGLRVPWFPATSVRNISSLKEAEEAMEFLSQIINELRKCVMAFNMVELKDEDDPESRLGTKSGAHLDATFGEGTGATFAKRVDLSDTLPIAADVTEYVHPKGYKEVRTVWSDQAGNEVAKLRLHMYPDRAHFAALVIDPAYRKQGFNRTLVGEANAEGRGGLGRWLRTLGIKIMTSQPDGEEAEQALHSIGWHWQWYDGKRLFGVRLDQRDRMDEYREWVEGGSDPKQEPSWHRQTTG